MSENHALPSVKLPFSNWDLLLQQIGGWQTPSQEYRSSGSELFLNRELSWLEFNERVLSEAADETVPPLERLRFAAIVSSNLDEFFMVRVAELSRMVQQNPGFEYPDGIKASELYAHLRGRVHLQKARQAAVFRNILETLKIHQIFLFAEFTADSLLDGQIRERLPVINPVLRRARDPLPALPGGFLHVFVRFPREYAILTIEGRGARLLELPSQSPALRRALLERWLSARANELFSNRQVIEAFPFKIIREAALRYQPENDDSLEEQILEAVSLRTRGKIVRLEVDAPSYSEGAFFLATLLGLDSASLYRYDLPLDIPGLVEIYKSGPAALKYPAIEPVLPEPFQKPEKIFAVIKRHDILLHHPYDSFDAVVNFLKEAARDSQVTEIYHTVYRTDPESPVLQTLKQAAEAGKKVTVYVEIKARFDEINNVRWAAELRRSGVKVVPPLGQMKVHSKVTQVIRREEEGPVSYLHLGTGNYHSSTARQYSDLGLLTSDPGISRDISAFFAALSKREEPDAIKELLVAPTHLHRRMMGFIEEEIRFHQAQGGGRIIAKANALVDPDIIRALYKASAAGVQVDLVVRGICSLRPGLKGLSDNIRVISIIDRFLEHSRIYYFRHGGDDLIYLSSADWMPRNFYTRLEIAFPVKDPELKKYVLEVILSKTLADNTKASILLPDGTYQRVEAKLKDGKIRSQFEFAALAEGRYRDTRLERRINLEAF